jgi:hypothetical protein
LWPGRHTPAPHRQLLKRLEQKALEECADASQRAKMPPASRNSLALKMTSPAPEPELQARQQFATDGRPVIM